MTRGERPTGIWKVMGSNPVGGLGKFFFRLESAFSLFSLGPSLGLTYESKLYVAVTKGGEYDTTSATIGFGLTHDWMKRWREFREPIQH